jgi:two-component system nitrate/nitrite response regulator NarL
VPSYTSMESIRPSCVVADDHPAVVAALGDVLAESGFDLVACAYDGSGALAAVRAHEPDLAVLDYRMRAPSGVALIARVAESSPRTKICVYTGDGDGKLAAAILDAGAHAIVLKQAPFQDVIRALHAILGGSCYVDPAVVGAVSRRQSRRALTKREREVLSLLAEGHGQKEIGAQLSIGVDTVRTHLRKARERLAVGSATQAVAEAIRQGLLR